MKTLSKMTSTAFKVGKAVYKASSDNTPSRSLPQQQQPQQVHWTMMVGLLGGAVVMFIIILALDRTILSMLLGLLAWIVSFFVFALILECIFPRKQTTDTSQVKVDSTPTSCSLADTTVAIKIKDALLSNNECSGLADLCKTMSIKKKIATLEHGFNMAVSDIIDNGSVSEQVQNTIQDVVDTMGVSIDVLKKLPSWQSLIKMLVINDLLCGKIPCRYIGADIIPVNLQKDEVIVWCFWDVQYYEPHQKRVNHGISQGLSVRIAKGLYYHAGAFKREPVIKTEQILISNGCLLLTNKNIYFYSGTKSMRVPYAKIVAYTPYEDGLGVQKEAASAKPMTFAGLDGWFAYNVVKNIFNIE